MNPHLLLELYSLFDVNALPPEIIFDEKYNEPSENPDWKLIFQQRWDTFDLFTLRMNWDGFHYMNDEALLYYFPLLIKSTIVDPRSIDLLFDLFLRMLSDKSNSLHRLVGSRLNIKHWNFLIKVFEDHDYVENCQRFELVDELLSSSNYIKSLVEKHSGEHD